MRSDVSSGVPTGFLRRALAVLLALRLLLAAVLLPAVDGLARDDEHAVVAGGVKSARAAPLLFGVAGASSGCCGSGA